MTATRVPAAVALPLIQNRAERLATEMRSTARGAERFAEAVEGIAADLADVAAQLAPAVAS